MLRPGGQLAITQIAQLAADRGLVQADAELFEYPPREVPQSPPHHTVDGGDRPALHDRHQSLAVGVVELWSMARRLAVDQPLGTVLIESQNPIADGL